MNDEPESHVWAQSFPPRFRFPKGQPVEFTPEQETALGAALLEAEKSILAAIKRELDRVESYDGPRNVVRLTRAYSGLRASSGQAPLPLPSPFFDGDDYPDDEP
jgi:hypothetical protein